ncbi:amidohydrolase family protein [Chelativorans sp. AA-79]|uniref:amidohydrolase family protein n=1 Tax=Chelativorans sp. AA-79 TaxID=3028735 RepID=UPI0023F779B2|nr:amidohydrolase family protein [Chelativorans sp. AA-79]WEX08089.1 amidohydrolase family protein [Chelativorans sp. AA-79]
MTAQVDAPLVDSHLHIYTRDMPIADGAWHHPGEDASIERCLAMLDANGVTFGVISAASIYGTYNDYVRAALKKHKRLRATLMPDLDWDIRILEQYRDEGFLGIRLLWRPKETTPDINSEPYRRILRRCADLGWHVHLTERPERIAHTIAAIENAGANVVLDHMVLIDTDEGVNDPGFKAALAAMDRGKTWVKMSGGFRFKKPGLADQVARELVAAGGWDRVMWASDWPFAGFEHKVTYAETLAKLAEWVPDPAMRHCITGRTPLRFFFT